MNLPNLLTLLRIFIIPFFVAILLTDSIPNRQIWGLVLFLTASITDVLDGYIARRRRQVTTMGIILDPIADKILISSAFIALVQLQYVPAWIVAVIIGREFAVTGLRNVASSEGLIIRASALGKTKMILQVVAISLILVYRYQVPHAADDVNNTRNPMYWASLSSLWLVLSLAIWSMAHYFINFWGKISQHRERRIRRKKLFRRRRKILLEEPHEKPVP